MGDDTPTPAIRESLPESDAARDLLEFGLALIGFAVALAEAARTHDRLAGANRRLFGEYIRRVLGEAGNILAEACLCAGAETVTTPSATGDRSR